MKDDSNMMLNFTKDNLEYDLLVSMATIAQQ